VKWIIPAGNRIVSCGDKVRMVNDPRIFSVHVIIDKDGKKLTKLLFSNVGVFKARHQDAYVTINRKDARFEDVR